MAIDLDLQEYNSHDKWSDRDKLPREPVHKKQRLRIYASHLPDGCAEFDCTTFRTDTKGALILQSRGELVCAFAPGMWSSFESVAIPDDGTDTA